MNIVLKKLQYIALAALIGIQPILFARPSCMNIPQYYFDALYTQAYKQALPHLSEDCIATLKSKNPLKKLHILVSQDNQKETDNIQSLCIEVAAECTYKLLSDYSMALTSMIDKLEKASTYWQWCLDHPYQYAVIKSPNQWFKKDQSHIIFEKQTMGHAMLQLCTERYGRIIQQQLLFKLCKNPKERFMWAEESIALVSSYTINEPYTHNQDMQQLAIIIDTLHTAVQSYIKNSNIQSLVMPSHAKRYWLAYTLGTIGFITITTLGIKYKASIIDGMHKGIVGAKNGFDYQIKDKLIALHQEITKILWPHEIADIQDAVALCEKANEGLDAAQKCLTTNPVKPSKIPGIGSTLNNINDAIIESKQAAQSLAESGKALIKVAQQLIDGQSLNFKLFGLIPAAAGFYGMYKGISGIKQWFTKQDRRQLYAHLHKAYDILIQANNTLSDLEYGTLVYTLDKAIVQAEKNVSFTERTAFIHDIQYILSTTSTVTQKKEALAHMWHKYQALKSHT
ncbi:MAG TPA: hypothetical protein VGW78_03875 [Candidatus Babeliales bacterium]|nr:hypothetical protein [Candidatus Babeliales bacterium]